MPNNNALVKGIEEKADIKYPKNISSEDAKKIFELLEKGEINEKELEAFTISNPSFINSISQLVGALPKLLDQVGDINKQTIESINHINQTTKALTDLASDVQSDNAKVQIAKLIVQVAGEYNETLKQINSNNNNLFRSITTVTVGALVFLVGFFGINND
jgi:chromosome segregation ATPase